LSRYARKEADPRLLFTVTPQQTGSGAHFHPSAFIVSIALAFDASIPRLKRLT